MKLAVFGATGGLGRQVVQQALVAGHSVRALVRAPGQAGLSESVRLVTGHVLDAQAVAETVEGVDAMLSCLGTNLVKTFARRGRSVAPGTGLMRAGVRYSRCASALISAIPIRLIWRLRIVPRNASRLGASHSSATSVWATASVQNGKRSSGGSWLVDQILTIRDGPAIRTPLSLLP